MNVSDQTLMAALDMLEQGIPADDILARFPEEAAGLRPFLNTAAQLSVLAPNPPAEAKAASRKAFLAAAAAPAATVGRPWWFWLRQALAPALALAAFLIFFGAAFVSASAASLPGDALYNTKLFVEQARLSRAGSPEERMALIEQFRQERIREVEMLLLSGREADVTFDGMIETLADDHWVVASILVGVTGETAVEGYPQIDELARVYGRTHDGNLTASRIIVLTGDAPPPEPVPPVDTDETPAPAMTATPSHTPAATPAATSTNTNTPTTTSTATPTPTETPTETPTPVKTAAPPLTPTYTPTPPPVATQPPPPSHNGNDNDNDNEDNNVNDDNSNSDDGDNGNDDNMNDNNDNSNDNGGSDNDNDNSSDNGGSDNDNNNSSDNGGSDNDNDNSSDNGGSDNDNDNSSDNGGSDNDNNDNSNDNDDNDNSDHSDNDNGNDDDNDNN